MAWPIVAPTPIVAEHAVVFRDLFKNQCQFRHFQHDLTGLIVLPNKSLAHIARCILESADNTNLSRFLSEAPWREDVVNRRRICFMLQDTTPPRRRRRDSLVVLDATLCEHVGSLFDDVDRHDNYEEEVLKAASYQQTRQLKVEFDRLKKKLGIFQQFAKYEGRIREQIGYGAIESMEDLESVRHAAQLSGAASFIEELPERYDTPLGKWELEEGTVKLSGGQWQRLALARACIKQDAALDPEAEEVFFEQLLREIQGQSIIFTSHRFSTVRGADQILSLRHGHIDEQGAHEEMMQHNGGYAALFLMQARWYG
jgi:ABC-type phosphate transport system ATPase subunit